jgi:hypothetical protein
MSFVAVAIGGAAALGLGGAIISSNASKDAAQTQADAANQATNAQLQMYQQQRQDQMPYTQAGYGALSQLQNPNFQHNFGAADFQEDPAYQFDLQQGQQALERSAAAKGGLMSGGTLKDLTSYAQGQASNEYQNAYNRFTNNQTNQFNRLASVAGIGQTANGMNAAANTNTSNQIGNNITGAGNARGAAQIAGGQAWGNTLSSLGSGGANTWMQYQMMNRLAPQQYGPPGSNFGSFANSEITATPQLQMPTFGSSLGAP